jgi:pimeloyl-ACP methyl ester carboxylesterase
MIAAALVLLTQLTLSPCNVEGVKGPIRCGTYRVWENRATKQGRQIDLSVVVLEALSPTKKPDPLFMLAGGPGDAPSFNAKFFSETFAKVRLQRDLVLVDPRGTGKSRPLLCPELATPDKDGVLDDEILGVQAVINCRSRLEKNADLRQYTTEIAVDDLDEVRQALGYKQINLYGTSYGSRVAQVYMRRHPTSLRTVTMKGILPPSIALPSTHALAGEQAWQSVVERCKQDEKCAQAYPGIDDKFRALLKRLSANPVLGPGGNVPKLRVSAALFAESFRFFLYAPDGQARALKLIEDLTQDKPGLFENSLGGRRLLSSERLAAGFFLSVSCTEDIPYLPKDITPLVASTFGGDYRIKQQTQACSVWPRGEVSSQHRLATKSDIPTLIFSGEFDPVTPPAGGEEVVRGLSRGVHVVVRNNGHPIGNAADCIGSMIAAFIEAGDTKGLDTSCAASIPAVPLFPAK